MQAGSGIGRYTLLQRSGLQHTPLPYSDRVLLQMPSQQVVDYSRIDTVSFLKQLVDDPSPHRLLSRKPGPDEVAGHLSEFEKDQK